MRRLVFAAAAALFVMHVAATSSVATDAREGVTLSGNIVCAKCTLKVEGLAECHDVLVVKDREQKETQYWLVKNDVTEAFGEVCEAVRPAAVTGTTEERDGKHWIAPTKIEPREGE
jgi:hypothetical protein